MKNSQFNYTLKYGENNVLYNSLSNKLILLDPLLVDLYNAAVLNQEIDSLDALHPKFFEHLISNQFIVENDLNEVELVREIMKKVDDDESRYYLIINPTMNCNFKCWYCYESHIKESKMNSNSVKNILSHVHKVFKNNKKIKHFTIGWFGGEPLLYFDRVMLPLMREIEGICSEYNVFFDQNITTNGFLINKMMIQEFKRYNLGHFQITLDGNRFVHDTVRFVSKARGSYDDIIKNMKDLVRNEIAVTARINFTKSNLPGIEEIYEDLEDLDEKDRKFFDISFHQVWQETATDLTERLDFLIDYFRSNGIQTRDGNIPNNLMNSCYADKKNHATINYDGNVFKCTARDFKVENREGVLNDEGEIEWNQKFYDRIEIKLKNQPCQKCSLLPLCNGGCSQIAIEAEGQDFCVYNYDEVKKKEIVYRKVREVLFKPAFN